ncbi:MAG: response regulator transcription factor [Aquabacterium sp.]|nr:MAG: response regulator transcription factor [Aquabacterium sp.]
MTLNVLIVDDEELARLRLRTLLGDCREPEAVAVGDAANAREALGWLAEHGPRGADVALLDVQMPGEDGLVLAERMRQQAPGLAVIFVTAHPAHALRAFELEAVDYLTKPVRRERLQEALGRVARRLAHSGENGAAAPAPTITLTERGRIVRVPVSEVLYLKAELKYVTLRTATHTYVLDDSLTELEHKLGPDFVRVHRNALVARKAMRAIERRHDDEEGGEGWAVSVAPTDEWLAVSRRQVATVKEAMDAR